LIVEDIWGLQTNSFVTGSSHPKIIYYSSTQISGSEEINIMNYNGSSQMKLTDNTVFDIDPIFTPAGNKILYIGISSGRFQFFTMDLDGTNQKNISNNDRSHSFPNFTSDGLKIIYESTRRISIMDIDGSNQTDLKIRNNNKHPNLSPDNKTIVFSTEEWGGTEIGIIDIDGSNLKRITNTPGEYEQYPQFTPDGQSILGISNYGTLFKMDLDGSNVTILFVGMGFNHFDISPNGEKVVFVSNSGELYVTNIDGSNSTKIITGLNSMRNPRFSPDGDKILLHTEMASGDIYMMNTNGTDLINLTNSTTVDRLPRIQPRP